MMCECAVSCRSTSPGVILTGREFANEKLSSMKC